MLNLLKRQSVRRRLAVGKPGFKPLRGASLEQLEDRRLMTANVDAPLVELDHSLDTVSSVYASYFQAGSGTALGQAGGIDATRDATLDSESQKGADYNSKPIVVKVGETISYDVGKEFPRISDFGVSSAQALNGTFVKASFTTADGNRNDIQITGLKSTGDEVTIVNVKVQKGSVTHLVHVHVKVVESTDSIPVVSLINLGEPSPSPVATSQGTGIAYSTPPISGESYFALLDSSREDETLLDDEDEDLYLLLAVNTIQTSSGELHSVLDASPLSAQQVSDSAAPT